MTAVRRPSLLEPGEPLLLSRSTIGTVVRFRSFAEASGLDPAAILSSPLIAIPVPVYTDFGTHADGRERRRWEGTRAEFMWHPLMWLPPRVSGRYQVLDAHGHGRPEDDDLYAIRLAFEMSVSGLYDAATGTWLDILSTVGIDITDDLDLARVQDWLDGYPDPVLDDIDLSDYMDAEPSSWAIETALAMREDLTHASRALIADDLVGTIDDTLNPEVDLSHPDLLLALRSVTGLSDTFLHDVPTSTIAHSHESHPDFFARVHDLVDHATGAPDKFTALDYLAQTRERLIAVREEFWPHLDALNHDGGEPVGAHA